jgi:hypothetical protein
MKAWLGVFICPLALLACSHTGGVPTRMVEVEPASAMRDYGTLEYTSWTDEKGRRLPAPPEREVRARESTVFPYYDERLEKRRRPTMSEVWQRLWWDIRHLGSRQTNPYLENGEGDCLPKKRTGHEDIGHALKNVIAEAWRKLGD